VTAKGWQAMPVKTADELRDLICRIVEAVGTPADSALMVSNHLVAAHLAGHDSHGVQHIPRYVREVKAGEIVPWAVPEIASETPCTALVKAHWGWGMVCANYATRLAIQMARANKVALVGVVEVNHIGRVGDYAEQAAEHGVILMIVSGGQGWEKPAAAPYGGSKAVLAPNPIAMGFPAAEESPVLLDFATTAAAGGKVALAKAKGQKVPPGWIIDSSGNPSIEPDDYYNGGALLPFGGHKGFGIMIATEILGRVLSGADAYSDPKRNVHSRHAGVTLIAVDSGAFSSREQFADRTTELVKRVRAVPPAPGFAEVMAPGDYENRSRLSNPKQEICIPESTWRELVETAGLLGVKA
jgi:LDH2 family malate/lactate/ureidoglycolate dehydrogenase